MQVSQQRLRTDIEANAEFGAIDVEQGRGRTVLTGSEADRKARERFVERLEAAGLNVRVDAVGNIVGRWVPPSADPEASPVAAGSHLDSVPRGGIFDGPLGVYGALEAVRAIQESDIDPERPLAVVSFTEEEGLRFDIGTLGSSVAAGVRDVETALDLTDDEGVTLAQRLADIGFAGDADVDAAAWDAWVELHIEQGTELETAGVPVGVVDAITGLTTCKALIHGEANHAGATPMSERTDALAAASEFVLDVERAAKELVASESSTAVGTVGSLDVEPNNRNTVPGTVTAKLDVRDVEYASMNAIVDRAHKSLTRLEADRGVETEFDRYRDTKPSHMSDRCVDAAHRAGDRYDIGTHSMYSAAMHDTANVARVADSVLLFAPSRGGLSHNPREWTDWTDCARATQVLAGTMARLAT